MERPGGIRGFATLLTSAEIAKWLGVSQQWVRDHASGRRRPLLPAIRISGLNRPTYRFSEEAVSEWLKKLQANT